MQMLAECHAATIQKVNLVKAANMDSVDACESLVQLVDKALSLTKVDLRMQAYYGKKVERVVGVSVIYAKSETEPGIITCATLKEGTEEYMDEYGYIKTRPTIDTVLFQRETQRTNRQLVVVDSSE